MQHKHDGEDVVGKRPFHNPPPAPLPANAPLDAVKAEFARRLQRAFVEKGWNQSELARRAEKFMPDRNFPRDNISKYVRGKVLPGPTHLNAMARALSMKPDDLLPQRGVPQAGQEHPALHFQDLGDGNVWLRVNRALSFETALEIMNLIKKEEQS